MLLDASGSKSCAQFAVACSAVDTLTKQVLLDRLSNRQISLSQYSCVTEPQLSLPDDDCNTAHIIEQPVTGVRCSFVASRCAFCNVQRQHNRNAVDNIASFSGNLKQNSVRHLGKHSGTLLILALRTIASDRGRSYFV